MGLYKIMFILFNIMKTKDAFYISLENHKIKVIIKIKKEFICNDEDFIS